MSYDFTTLDPNDFEALVSDLLSRSWGARLESFKTGKDGGVDLRHSRIPEHEPKTIVQCKRYAPDKFTQLLSSCKKEKTKLMKLRPKRYVLVTSASLSPLNKEKIVTELEPWCKSPEDIYGPDELNGLLRDYPDIERAHFKLWISSTAVLETVLHAKIFSITDATIKSAKEQLSKLVIHDGFAEALDILSNQHHVLIVGNPGIGKSTLAYMLMCHYMNESFEPIKVMSNIEDAWDMVASAVSSDRKLVILYDDFLGRLKFESLRFVKNEEHSLMDFLDKVARSPNLRFILTTREYILEDAKCVHGAFDERSNELLQYTLSLANYTEKHRAQMLFNHLYFSDLPDSRLEKLLTEQVYRKIVAHQHFNPRVVMNISKYANSRAMTDEEYVNYVEKEFDNPSQLWEIPFKREISPLGRRILFVLWSFNGRVDLQNLQKSLLKIYEQDLSEDFLQEYEDALRQLEGNFIITERYPGLLNSTPYFMIVQFHNPSVEEFVEGKVLSNSILFEKLAQAVVSIEQVEFLLKEIRNSTVFVSKSFLVKLRMKADKYECVSNGHFFNLKGYEASESILTWVNEKLSLSKTTQSLLEIESLLKANDGRSNALRARVLTQKGWTSLLETVLHHEYYVYDISHLQKWIIGSSYWNDREKTLSENLFRSALIILLDKNVLQDPSSILILVESVTTIEPLLTLAEQEIVSQASNSTAENYISSEADYDNLYSEADKLEKLNGHLDDVYTNDFPEQFKDLAQELENDEEDKEATTISEQHHYAPKTDEIFDMDKLFTGLLDR